MRSDLEATFAFQCKAHQLPEPQREYLFAERIGRRWRADFAWVDRKVLVEIEGGTWVVGRHSRGAGFEKDCEKLNAAAALGFFVFRFTTDQVNTGQAVLFMKKVLKGE